MSQRRTIERLLRHHIQMLNTIDELTEENRGLRGRLQDMQKENESTDADAAQGLRNAAKRIKACLGLR